MKKKILYYGLGILALLLIAGGVYFYRLNAGEYTECKKMVMIK